MKKYSLIVLILGQLAFASKIYSQNVAINATGNMPDTSAMLDVSGTDKGFLAPRMTTAQQNAIILPATGLLIFNISTNLFMVNTGTAASPVWTPLVSGTTTNTLGSSANTLTSTVNGIAATSPIVNSISNTSSANTLTTTVNGIAGTGVPMINTNALSLSGTNVTSTINGVASSALDITPAISLTAWSLTGNTGTNSGTKFLGTTDNVSVRFKTNNTERMVLDSNGRLGIGTTTPSYLLSLDGTNARTIWMERHTTANNAGNNLSIQAGGATSGATDKNGGNLYLKSGISTGTGSSNIYFQTDSAAASSGTTDNTVGTRMTIRGNGMVGLGTTNPVSNFHLYGDSRSGFVPTNAGAGGGPEISFGRGGFSKPGSSIQFLDYNAYGGGLSFNVHKGTANGADGAFADNWPLDVVQAMTIDNKGFVSIGHTLPTAVLHTIASGAKTANFTGNLLTNITTSSTTSINKVGLEVQSTGTWNGAGAKNTGLYVSSVTGGTNNYDAIFNGGGYVGIGTVAPTSAFHIYNGQEYIDGGNQSNPLKINIGRDGYAYGNRGDNKKAILFETQSSSQTGDIASINAGDEGTGGNTGNRYLSFSVGLPLTEAMYINNQAGVTKVGVNNSSPSTTLDVTGDFATRMATFTAVNGTGSANNNAAIGAYSFVKISGPSAAFTISGLAGGNDGKIVTLYNSTSQNMTIANNSGSSSAGNKILTLTGANIVTTGTGTVTLQYDGASSVWIVIGTNL